MYSKILCALFLLAIFQNLFIKANAQTIFLNGNEKILYNAKIFTADIAHPYAEAVAIRADKIVAVGNFESIKTSVGKDAALIDMRGGFILPGFIDSHSHSLDGGYSLMRANVYDSVETAEDLEKYAEQVQKDGTGMVENFLVIDGLNISTWSHIDELQATFSTGKYADQPVILRGSDGHTAWANKKVMQLAGINKNFIDTISQSYRKYFGVNNNGEPNGFYADSGFDKVDAIMPEEKIDWRQSGINAMNYNNALGITAWLDPAAGDVTDEKNDYLETYKMLSIEHKLTAHVAAIVVSDPDADAQPQINKLLSLQKKYNSTKDLSVIGFKVFADGVIEYPTQTAAVSKRYINSGSYGALMFHPKSFAKFVTLADKNNLLVHVHAIGDLAVTEALNGFEAARKANGNYTIPHTITHLQIVLPKDFPRFKQLNVLASYQLLWALGDVTTIDIVKPFIDPELYKWQYPARSMLQAGATICGASDWNVSSANPFEAIYEAETRKGEKGVLDSTQCMPRIDMLYAYTINSAKALRSEHSIGSISPGKFADLILVDRDVLTVSPEEMEQTKVVWTMFEGKIVYQSK